MSNDDATRPKGDTSGEETVVTTGEEVIVREDELTREIVHEPPLPAGSVETRLIQQDERVSIDPDGAVRREVDQVVHAPRHRNPIIPALLILLLLVAAGLAALWYFTREEQEPVPNVEGLALNDAISRLQNEGFKTDVTSRPSEEQAGIVISQQPPAEQDADEGSTVLVVSSKGPETVTVPNAVGVTETDARDRLAAVGLGVNVVKVFSEEPEGQVTAQNPGAGEKVAEDTTIRLNVSKGTGEVEVPSLVGVSRDEAVSTLQAARLRANVVTVPSAEPEGTVVAQNPTVGTTRAGSSVRLNVSSGTP